jgi:tripartite-type tricarboxylate transporter receptor subunit TctC
LEVNYVFGSTLRGVSVILAASLIAAACGGGGAGTSPTPAAGSPSATAVAAIAPTRATEFVVQTAQGGSSDIYARLWVGVMDKEKYLPQPIQVVNKEGGSGAVAFQYVFDRRGDGHYLMVTLNSFWTTIITQKAIPFKTTDFTPIANMALDPFFLWVNTESSIKTAGDFVTEAKARAMVAAGTGAKQEDEVLFRRIQELAGTKPFTYLSQTSGATVAAALAGKQGGVEVTVNNPSEARTLMQAGKVKAICAFTPASPTEGVFKDLPTCKSQGLAIDDYYNVRAVVAPPGVSAGQQKFWVDTFQKISNHADWTKYMSENALVADFRSGEAFKKLIEDYQKIHTEIATKFGWIS